MIDDRKYLKDGYRVNPPKCRITEKQKKDVYYSFLNRNQICTIEKSLGDFRRIFEEIKEKRSTEENTKVKKLERK